MATRSSQNSVGNNSSQIPIVQAVRQGNDIEFIITSSLSFVTATPVILDSEGNPISGGSGGVIRHNFFPGFNAG